MLPLVFYDEVRVDTSHTYHRITGWRQAKPYNIPTDVKIEKNFGDAWSDARSWAWGPDNNGLMNIGEFRGQMLLNSVIGKFNNQLGDSSSFGATLTAELKETLGMVTGTVIKLATAALAVKRMDLQRAATILGLPYHERTIKKVRYTRKVGKRKRKRVVSRVRVMRLPTGREVSKTLANGWLLYSYGVKPLAQDLYNGMDILQRPVPDVTIDAKKTGSGTYIYRSSPWDIYWSRTTYTAKVRVRCSAEVSVANPNLWLANQMGLINPVQWANEAIPFSFVVDWFSNLSQVIGQLTAYAGLNIKDPWMSTSIQMRESTVGQFMPSSSKERNIYIRRLTLPTPKLVFAYERPNVQRALNAISLLIGFLPK